MIWAHRPYWEGADSKQNAKPWSPPYPYLVSLKLYFEITNLFCCCPLLFKRTNFHRQNTTNVHCMKNTVLVFILKLDHHRHWVNHPRGAWLRVSIPYSFCCSNKSSKIYLPFLSSAGQDTRGWSSSAPRDMYSI